MERGGKKTAAAVHQEITRELDTLLPRIFAERRKTGELDLEAVELAIRTALHCGGAAAKLDIRTCDSNPSSRYGVPPKCSAPTYTGAIETAAKFSGRIYTEAHQRG